MSYCCDIRKNILWKRESKEIPIHVMVGMYPNVGSDPLETMYML